MSLLLGLVLSPFLATPMPANVSQPRQVAEVVDMGWRRRTCLALRCNDAEWAREVDAARREAVHADGLSRFRAQDRRHARLRASAHRRLSRDNYSNRYRIGSRHGVELLREGESHLVVAFDAAYRLAPRSDDGIGEAGPVFRSSIDFGRRFGERTHWSQKVLVETGQGQTFVKQVFDVNVTLMPNWTLEGDYVIRHRTSGKSGTETAEGWLGVRRRF
ncbi:hypothetical protein H4F99_01565 [Lysobacter sp. SG-8]|uniref:DUF481 domain-containing protein n=1 Tax=Marilutibacter penaei TaxID=2759900 RepID=A0A7W3U203_9GAMM|nr:DUF481 domain-containing protein [Lysobacter penaei]MBB1087170.1 hypothetical protein [Lysobacter penaei]